MNQEDGIAETVQFYLPYDKDGIEKLPDRIEEYWAWLVRQQNIGKGKYNWTLQTYLYLRDAGIACAIVTRFPERGIVISHRDFLPVFLLPRPDVFLVCIKPDRKEHTWAQHYVVQNKSDKAFQRFGRNRVTDILFWPQPSLVPRRAERHDKCENIAFFGRSLNLAPELKTEDWKSKLANLGFNWTIVPLEAWHDYSEVDLTVSVRGFGDSAKTDNPVFDPDSKPPAKLTNSWLAGVPAIVGQESSYRSVRTSQFDFMEIGSVDELVQTLVAIRDDKSTYEDLRARARSRSEEFSAQVVTRRWEKIIRQDILPNYRRWMSKSRWRRLSCNLANVLFYLVNLRNLLDLLRVVTRGAERGLSLVMSRKP